MKSAILQGPSRNRVAHLLKVARSATRADSRMDLLSAELVGLPYRANPLIGTSESPEVLTADTTAFDCVTYIETVLALAHSRDVEAFLEKLRAIRYASGEIRWDRRNHYMTEWVRNNLHAGTVRRLSRPKPTVEKKRLLNVVPGLPVRQMSFACVRKNDVLRNRDAFRTGDIVLFASTRAHLDVFHCGILVAHSDTLMLRHASRSRGCVVEEDLSKFLKQNRMAGVIVVRPAEAA
jgi:hypothetical protein